MNFEESFQLRVVSRNQGIFSSTRDQSLVLRLLCASDKLVILLVIQHERIPIVFNFRLFTMSFDNPIILQQVIYEAIDVSLPGIPLMFLHFHKGQRANST